MNRHDTLERELTAWFADVASPRVPDYLTDIVQSTAGRRQRPRWTFPGRWLPMTLVTLHTVPKRSFPWRTVGLLAVIAALLISLVVVSVGSRRRSAEPFGLAANGLAAYASGGDIWTVDPKTASRRPIVTGPENDHDPRWSPDGSRIAFLRNLDGPQQVVIVTADASEPVVVASRAMASIDSDSVRWAPDSQSLVVASGGDLRRVDARDGAVTTLPLAYAMLESFWRPPDGRQLLFLSGQEYRPVLSLYDLVTGEIREVPIPPTESRVEELRPMGWTPDGRRVLVHRWLDGDPVARTWVIDPESGAFVTLDVGYGHVSNAGDRVAGIREGANEAICVVPIDGGPCKPFGPARAQPVGPHFTSVQWSPDDRWIVIRPPDGSRTVLLDSSSGELVTDADWVRTGADTWRRDALP